MKSCYINGMGCISTQKTIDNSVFLDEVKAQETNIWKAIAPKYRDYISPVASRRMAKGVKMGVVASTLALQEAEMENPDAIVIGSGMGCVQNSEKFLESILDNNEQFLTPISFIQSTHNTAGAQIALVLKCKSYNVTYVQSAVSFESALLDALLLFTEGAANNVLIGGVEELGKQTSKLHQLIKHIKEDEIEENQLLQSKTAGSAFGEGAQFFALSTRQSENAYAQVVDLDIINYLPEAKVKARILQFLAKNQAELTDLDAVILGNNGDGRFDKIYQKLQNSIFENTPQIAYKHLSGEYNTASAFGMWTAAKILKEQRVPAILKLNERQKTVFKTILLYNQYRGKSHSLVLMKSVVSK